MTITNFFNGRSSIFGFTFDTDKKSYKQFKIDNCEWAESNIDVAVAHPIEKQGFTIPGDIRYYIDAKYSLNARLQELRKLGFTEDKNMSLDFGLFTK